MPNQQIENFNFFRRFYLKTVNLFIICKFVIALMKNLIKNLWKI